MKKQTIIIAAVIMLSALPAFASTSVVPNPVPDASTVVTITSDSDTCTFLPNGDLINSHIVGD